MGSLLTTDCLLLPHGKTYTETMVCQFMSVFTSAANGLKSHNAYRSRSATLHLSTTLQLCYHGTSATCSNPQIIKMQGHCYSGYSGQLLC